MKYNIRMFFKLFVHLLNLLQFGVIGSSEFGNDNSQYGN